MVSYTHVSVKQAYDKEFSFFPFNCYYLIKVDFMRISYKEVRKKYKIILYEVIHFTLLSKNICFWAIVLNFASGSAQHSAVWNRKMQ